MLMTVGPATDQWAEAAAAAGAGRREGKPSDLGTGRRCVSGWSSGAL